MDHPRAVLDDTLVRLETLTAQLTERLGESRDVRARLVEALRANAWPDVRTPRGDLRSTTDAEARVFATSHRATAWRAPASR